MNLMDIEATGGNIVDGIVQVHQRHDAASL